MRKKKCISILIAALLVIIFAADTVCAATGSITVKTEKATEVILYQITDKDGYMSDWENVGISQEQFSDKETALMLQEYAIENKIEGVIETKFENLSEGTYLIIKEDVIVPFLVTVPMMVDGVEVYDIETFPKTSPETPDILEKKEPEDTTPSRGGGRLPQTGQLNWPIPVMAVSGLLLFVAGWCICFRKKG